MHLVEFPSKSIETLVGIFFQYFDEISSLCHWYISEEILERLSQGWLIRCNFLIRFWPLFFWRFFQDHFSKKKKNELSGLLMKVSLHLFIKLQQIIQPFSEGQVLCWGNDWFPLLHQGSLKPGIRNCSAQVFWSQPHIYSHNFLLHHIITQWCQPCFEVFRWWSWK